MMWNELPWLVLKLGLPVALISAYGLRRLYRSGRLLRGDDAKTRDANLKELGKKPERGGGLGGLLQNKWMQFGGGFYGACALWTFMVIEANDIFGFVASFAGFDALFAQGVGALLRDLLTNQIQNLIAAFVWFRYWVDDGPLIGLCFLVGYGAYVLGDWVAKRA